MSGDQVTLMFWVYGLAGILTLAVEARSPLRAWWRKSHVLTLRAKQGSVESPPSRWRAGLRLGGPLLAGSLAAATVVVLWPMVPALAVRSWMNDRQASRQRAQKANQVRLEHLQERLTVREIEARELIHDPLNAVPSVPFGHLNVGWLALKSGLGQRDELWSFSAPWRNPWGRPERRQGYVVWRRGQARGHLFTEIQPAPDWTAALPTRPAFDDIEIPAFLRRRPD